MRYLTLIIFVFLFVGCKTIKYVPVEKTVYREKVKLDTLHTTDSVWLHDSVTVFMKGDTVWKDKSHKEIIKQTIYKTKTDTSVVIDSIPVPYAVEKELTAWEQFQLKYAVWSFGALCMVLLYFGYKLYKRIRND